MEIWQKIKRAIESNNRVALLYVLESKGSSPGRQGFKMIVSQNGELFGSIGGGMMEYNLVEFCKKIIHKEDNHPILKRQIHRKNNSDSSGLICSGEQTVGIYFLHKTDLLIIDTIISSIQTKKYGILDADEKGLTFTPDKSNNTKFKIEISKQKWKFQEDLGDHSILHIIGGGHVSQALSKFAPDLDFRVIIYDDRNNLNTFSENAKIRHISDYQNIASIIPEGNQHYVVVMSFMYSSDLTTIEQLLPSTFKYLGLMGSKNKIKLLLKDLRKKGIPEIQIQKLYAPIGIQISSQTPSEIAISILGQLIRVRNKKVLPNQ